MGTIKKQVGLGEKKARVGEHVSIVFFFKKGEKESVHKILKTWVYCTCIVLVYFEA